MRSGIVVVPLAEESSSSGGILGGLLYRFGGVMLTIMYSVTGWAEGGAPSAPFSRTQGKSTREMFNHLNERIFSTKLTALRGQGYRHLMGAYKDVGMCGPLRIKTECKT